MLATDDRTDLPVLLLYNLDRAWTDHELAKALDETDYLRACLQAQGHPVTALPIYDSDLATPLRLYAGEAYIVLNWCEGVPGLPYSDAYVAQILESLNFCYTGSTPDVLALSADKRQIKARLDLRDVGTPRWRIYTSTCPDGWNDFPAIVKPSHEHCSIGITPEAVVMSPTELHHRIAYVLDVFQQPALVEDFIDGREFHIWLWGNGNIEMLPPAEMDFSAFTDVRDRLCTLDSKTDPTSIHYNQIKLRLPAPLDDDEYQRLEQISRAAYRAVGCRDYARIDIRLRDSTFYVLDVNPNADISYQGSLACAGAVAGYSYGAVGSHLINLAARRRMAATE